MKMKAMKITMLMAALTLMWGCSSDDDGLGDKVKFADNAKPMWMVDWTSNATLPDWKDPDPTKYECSMNVLVELDGVAERNSSERDMMGVFIDGECRGVSYRNVLQDGSVAFLLHLYGSSEENDHPMELRYYCDKLHHLTISNAIPSFEPSNLIDDTYHLVFDLDYGSTKFPIFTELTVMLPENLPFTPHDDDMLAVFVGDECRGVGRHEKELFEGWKLVVYSVQKGETAQVRYYSAANEGIYTVMKTFELNGFIQLENINF